MNQNRGKEEDKDENNMGPERQRRSLSDIRPDIPQLAPGFPTQFNDKIMELQGSDVKLVIQKELTKTDMGTKNRLSIPDGQVRNDFLTGQERLHLEEINEGGFRLNGLQVPLIDASLHEWTITVKKFHVRSFSGYVLRRPWYEIAIRNGLEEGNVIQIWSFRANERPHLVLVKLEAERRRATHSGSS